jgi:hypothetical protein
MSHCTSLKVGDRVTMTDPYHARAGQQGTIEAINSLTGDFMVHWNYDGVSQFHITHRSYQAEALTAL